MSLSIFLGGDTLGSAPGRESLPGRTRSWLCSRADRGHQVNRKETLMAWSSVGLGLGFPTYTMLGLFRLMVRLMAKTPKRHGWGWMPWLAECTHPAAEPGIQSAAPCLPPGSSLSPAPLHLNPAPLSYLELNMHAPLTFSPAPLKPPLEKS